MQSAPTSTLPAFSGDFILYHASRGDGLPKLSGWQWLMGALLFQTMANMKSRLVEIISDGSRLIDVDVRDPKTRKHLGTLRLRDIEAEVC